MFHLVIASLSDQVAGIKGLLNELINLACPLLIQLAWIMLEKNSEKMQRDAADCSHFSLSVCA